MVGRTRELKRVADLLRRARLVTVTGPGGVGKTRLALELVRGQVARQRHGVWLVDLASVAKGADPAAELARVLEVRDPRGMTATDSVRRHLANRDLLLVLDNCEHVVDACADAMLLVDVQAERSSLAAARELSAELGDRELEGWALIIDGLTAALAGMIEPARVSLQATLDLHRPRGVRRGEARALRCRASPFTSKASRSARAGAR